MKKEYIAIVATSFFVLAYVLDYFSGSIILSVVNPLSFLTENYLKQFPLTAFAIGIRSIALFTTVLLLISFIEELYFSKALGLLVLGVLTELYAIQQLATGMRFTNVQWTLSIAYAGILLIPPIFLFIILGTVHSVKKKFRPVEMNSKMK